MIIHESQLDLNSKEKLLFYYYYYSFYFLGRQQRENKWMILSEKKKVIIIQVGCECRNQGKEEWIRERLFLDRIPPNHYTLPLRNYRFY